MNIIETENLSYKYDESHFALSDLSIGFGILKFKKIFVVY